MAQASNSESRLIQSLAQIGETGEVASGGKARVLARLLQAGYPAPDGLVILPPAFDGDGLRPSAWKELQARLATWPARWPGVGLAVRSSALDEDSAAAAFAGEFATVLNVAGDEAIRQAIQTVYASRTNAAVYRQARRLAGPQRMAVLVQPLIPAECSGVCFSLDPVQPERRLLVINAGWGLGPGVVDGTVPADTCWLRRRDLAFERQDVAAKTRQIAPAAGGGLAEIAVPPEHHHVPCLPESWSRRIGEFALSLEQLLGRPQDVEWAVADGQLWLLQSRPITGLAAEATPAAFPVTWENEEDLYYFWSLWQLLPHEVLWPLEHDYLARLSQAEGEKRRRGGQEFVCRAWVANGRIYRGCSPNPEPEQQRRQRKATLEELESRLRAQGLTWWDYYRPAIVQATGRLHRFDFATATGRQLAMHLEDTLAVYHEHSVLHGLVWTSLKPFYAAYARITRVSEVEAETAANQLLVGETTALSHFIDGLYNLALAARAVPALAGRVADPPPNVMTRLQRMPEAADFLAQLEVFLDRFGERTGHGFGSEVTLCMPTLREQPRLLLSLIAPYLDPALEPPAEVCRRIRAARDSRIEALCLACPDVEVVADFRRQWALARQEATVLEDHNYYIDQLATGQLRRAVRFAGRWLAARGVLGDVDDVFWLHFAEILAALRADSPPAFSSVIAERQAQHRAWEKLEPPPVLGRPEATLPPRPPLAAQKRDLSSAGPSSAREETGRLHGLGASPGLVEGRARIMADGVPHPDLEPGDILIANNAGPLWTPFFPILAGLVLEEGAFGQHAAVTAREYGLPAVIHCRNATRTIPDGARLLVDGTAGIVQLLGV